MNLMTTKEKVFEIIKKIAGYVAFAAFWAVFAFMLVALS